MPKISLHSTTDPHAITKVLCDIQAENCFDTDETILIKPNCVTDDLPSSGITVDLGIVAGIVAYLQEHGFNNIIVGEGGMTLYDMPLVFEKVGLTGALRPYGIVPVDLTYIGKEATILMSRLDVKMAQEFINERFVYDFILNRTPEKAREIGIKHRSTLAYLKKKAKGGDLNFKARNLKRVMVHFA